MHPVIKIILLLMSCFLATMHTPQSLIAVLSLVLAGYVLTSLLYLGHVRKMMAKLRWFLISILIVYLWFTPGEPIFDIGYMPSSEGLMMGVSRIISLLAIILAVNLLLKSTQKDELIASIIWLTYPLALFGLSRERLAVRIALTFDAITDVELMLVKEKNKKIKSVSPLQRVSLSLTNIYQQIIIRADSTDCGTIMISSPTAPPVYQWLYLPVAAALFWLANLI